MDSFQRFLTQRKSNYAISKKEVEDFLFTLPNNDERQDFLMRLQKHISELEKKNYPSFDAKDTSTFTNDELLLLIESEKSKIENQNYFTLKEDEESPEVNLTRREQSLLAYLLRKYKAIPNHNDSKLASKFGNLAKRNSQNIRADLSFTNIEAIIAGTDIKDLEFILESMLEDVKNKKL